MLSPGLLAVMMWSQSHALLVAVEAWEAIHLHMRWAWRSGRTIIIGVMFYSKVEALDAYSIALSVPKLRCPRSVWRSPCALPAILADGREPPRSFWIQGSSVLQNSVLSPYSSFRWRVESRLQSAQVPSSSHGYFICKACRQVESEGPCVRYSASFVG
jgi:hypothetical protein